MNSTVSERRASVRFDMAFPVYVSNSPHPDVVTKRF